MSNENFDKNGVDKFESHWLKYAAFVVTTFAIYFGRVFFNDVSSHHFTQKYLSFGIAMDITL